MTITALANPPVVVNNPAPTPDCWNHPEDYPDKCLAKTGWAEVLTAGRQFTIWMLIAALLITIIAFARIIRIGRAR